MLRLVRYVDNPLICIYDAQLLYDTLHVILATFILYVIKCITLIFFSIKEQSVHVKKKKKVIAFHVSLSPHCLFKIL